MDPARSPFGRTEQCEHVTTLDKSFLLRGPFAGTISASLMQEIEKAIQRAIGLAV